MNLQQVRDTPPRDCWHGYVRQRHIFPTFPALHSPASWSLLAVIPTSSRKNIKHRLHALFLELKIFSYRMSMDLVDPFFEQTLKSHDNSWVILVPNHRNAFRKSRCSLSASLRDSMD